MASTRVTENALYGQAVARLSTACTLLLRCLIPGIPGSENLPRIPSLWPSEGGKGHCYWIQHGIETSEVHCSERGGRHGSNDYCGDQDITKSDSQSNA